MEGRHVIIEYVDKSTCLLSGTDDVLLEIQAAFSYFAKDYKFMPLFKRGVWDGKVYLFKVSNCKLPAGLVHKVHELGQQFAFEVVVLPSHHAEVIPFDAELFLREITPLCNFEIMDHQLGSVEAVLASNRRLILSPTSSGKSLILYLASRYIMKVHGKRILVIVPNKTLVEQLREDFSEYSTDGWGTTNDIHAVYAEQEIWTSHDVVVSTYQTAIKLGQEWYDQFGAIFVDEAHGATSASITTILGMTGHMLYHAGFTGTLNGTHMHELEMRARFGEVTKLVTTRELMDMGIVAQLQINAITLVHSEQVAKDSVKWKYPDEIEYLINLKERNDFLATLASSHDENVMILFNRVEHGRALHELISKQIEGTDKVIFYVDGNVAIADRKPIRALMEARKGCILLASFGTSSVGLSIKNIHHMVLGHPFKDRVRVLQTIGRGLRLHPTKKSVEVVDVGDKLSGKRKKVNSTYDHFLSRLELYQGEEFNYDVITLELPQ